mmetsp:Transcript_4805/g.9033  ORF Transcript_4805/g.9033 Transcript_4805/m.9033 type:complete len:263 (+) Transcript_4805:502-1290(+)
MSDRLQCRSCLAFGVRDKLCGGLPLQRLSLRGLFGDTLCICQAPLLKLQLRILLETLIVHRLLCGPLYLNCSLLAPLQVKSGICNGLGCNSLGLPGQLVTEQSSLSLGRHEGILDGTHSLLGCQRQILCPSVCIQGFGSSSLRSQHLGLKRPEAWHLCGSRLGLALLACSLFLQFQGLATSCQVQLLEELCGRPLRSPDPLLGLPNASLSSLCGSLHPASCFCCSDLGPCTRRLANLHRLLPVEFKCTDGSVLLFLKVLHLL